MESPPTSGWSGKHAVELYVRTYTTMLQSSGDIKIESLVQAHLGMGSVLHPLAASPQSDMGALLYAVRRLPAAISRCRHVIMGQSPQGFRAVLGADILRWQAVKAPARRRRWYHDGQDTLAVLIASTSVAAGRRALRPGGKGGVRRQRGGLAPPPRSLGRRL
jgi:hypothetical protein